MHTHTHTHTLTPHTHTLLTQGVDSGVEETIRESCQHLHESLDNVTCLAGQISLGRKLVERRVCAQLRPTEEGSGEEWGTLDNSDDFLSEQVKREGGREGQEGCDETTPLDFIWSVLQGMYEVPLPLSFAAVPEVRSNVLPGLL